MNVKIDIPNGQSGDWAVETFDITKYTAAVMNLCQSQNSAQGRTIVPERYTKLTYRGRAIMSNTPAELNDLIPFVSQVRKRGEDILINGLGLGIAVKLILEFNQVKSITVIEKESDVIALISPHLKDKRVSVIHADAFEYEPQQKFDVVWHDIWPSISSDNLSEMAALHRKYESVCNWQGSWCGKEIAE